MNCHFIQFTHNMFLSFLSYELTFFVVKINFSSFFCFNCIFSFFDFYLLSINLF